MLCYQTVRLYVCWCLFLLQFNDSVVPMFQSYHLCVTSALVCDPHTRYMTVEQRFTNVAFI